MCSLDIVDGSEDVIIINDAGVIIRTSVGEISQYGRDTQGVKLMNLGEDTRVASVAIVPPEDEEESCECAAEEDTAQETEE
jgi:DNA gyrase subunit A